MPRFSVYILRCSDGTLYTGATTNLDRRVREHGRGRASKYTRSRLPIRLVYAEGAASWGRALVRELEIKKLDRASKLRLCESFRRQRHSSR